MSGDGFCKIQNNSNSDEDDEDDSVEAASWKNYVYAWRSSGKTIVTITLVIAQSYSTQCSTSDSKFQYKWGRFINGSDFRWQNVLIYRRGTSWTSISFGKTLCLAYCCHTSKQPNSEKNRMKGSTNCNHAQYEMQSLCLFQIKAFVVDMYYGAFLLPMFFNILTQIWQPWSKN